MTDQGDIVEGVEQNVSSRLPAWLRKVLRRPCLHEDVVAVYGIDGPRLHCRTCGYSERISMQEWRSL